jgi:hypothetical protein
MQIWLAAQMMWVTHMEIRLIGTSLLLLELLPRSTGWAGVVHCRQQSISMVACPQRHVRP